MTKEMFMKRMDEMFISKEEFMRDLQKLFDKGVLTDEIIEKMEDNYKPIYPVAAAIYSRETQWYLNGSSEAGRREATRKCNYYKNYL